MLEHLRSIVLVLPNRQFNKMALNQIFIAALCALEHVTQPTPNKCA
jgi:hypothetical protein